MKKLFTLIFIITAINVYAQNSLIISANVNGDGFGTSSTTITSAVSKIKLDPEVGEFKTFGLKCTNLAGGHKLIISSDDVSLINGISNEYATNNVSQTFTFSKDISNKKITVSDVNGAGTITPYLSFTFVQTATGTSTPVINGAAPQIKVSITYIQKNGLASTPIEFPNATNTIAIDNGLTELKKFKLKCAALTAGHTLEIIVAGNTTQSGQYLAADVPNDKEFSFDDLLNKTVVIKDNDGANKTPVAQITFSHPANTNGGGTVASILNSPQSAVNIGAYKHTNYGYIDPSDPNTVHIFLDMFGNNLFETIPPGIPNHNYIVHIIYPAYSDQTDDIDYSVNQTSGTPNNGALLFSNTNILTTLNGKFQSKALDQNSSSKKYDIWKDKPLYLGNSQDDIAFTITSTTIDDNTSKPVTGNLGSYTIKMSSFFHGTFDVGLINSSLEDPTFTLVPAPDGSGNQVVKQTNQGKRGLVTVMATFYTSPIVLFEKYILKKNIPNFKLTGRDFLDDHSFFERIYPTIGVSINSSAFQNLFYGFNWEIARGLSVFGGRHWGQVNYFAMPGYLQNNTAVTQAQFDYYNNTRWRTAWAYGIKLDVLVVTNLFK